MLVCLRGVGGKPLPVPIMLRTALSISVGAVALYTAAATTPSPAYASRGCALDTTTCSVIRIDPWCIDMPGGGQFCDPGGDFEIIGRQNDM